MKQQEDIIKELLEYSFSPIQWRWDRLTDNERDIIKNSDNLRDLEKFALGLT